MNKTLIAMAVAGVMAAPMAAQADATIYGKIHVSIDSGDTGASADAPPAKASGLYWQSNSSRIGFKGSEDLGGNLKAVWQLESNAAFGSVGNSVSFGGRNTYVGLSGGWGTLIGGQHDTPFKTMGRKFDLFGDYVGDSRNMIQRLGGTNWDLRPTNVVAYTMPTIGGFNARVAYVIDDATEDASALSAYGMFKLANWLFALGYESQDNATGTSADGLRAGVQWAPGAFKLNAFYQTTSDNGGVSGNDFDSMGLGAGFKMGKNFLKAQYFMTEDKNSGATNSDANTIAVGWDYNMSKRSTVYIAYASTSNDDNVYYPVDRGGHGSEIWNNATAGTAGDDPSVISFGMIHKF